MRLLIVVVLDFEGRNELQNCNGVLPHIHTFCPLKMNKLPFDLVFDPSGLSL